MNVYLSYNSALRIILYGKTEGSLQQISKLSFGQISTLVDTSSTSSSTAEPSPTSTPGQSKTSNSWPST